MELLSRRCPVSTIHPLVPLLLATCAAFPQRGAGQVPRPGGDLTTENEVAGASAWSLGAELLAVPRTGGEALEGVGSGTGGAVSGRVELDERLALGASIGLVSHADGWSSEHATTIDIMVDLAWIWTLGGFGVEAGPVVGYGWLDRGIFTGRTGGFLAGGAIGVNRLFLRSLALVASVDASWTQFPSLPLLPPVPRDLDGSAIGSRVRLALGLSWTLSRASER